MNLWGGSRAQQARLISGLVLFAFAGTHFVNHALGLVSLDAALAVDAWRLVVIRSLPGTVILVAAVAVHVVLAAWRVVRRRTFRLPVREWLQIALGFAIPILLLPHIINTRLADSLGLHRTYTTEVGRIWMTAFLDQSVLLLIVWVHGCIGLHYWLRSSSWYDRLAPVLLGVAVLIPFAAVAGASVQGRAVPHDGSLPPQNIAAHLAEATDRSREVYGILLGLVLALVALQAFRSRRARRIPIRYAGGPTVRTEAGPSLLEISRRHGIPHTSVCGGRGRCSTCRVLILEGTAPPPSDAELRTLRAIGAGPDVRLACQVRPTHALTLFPLLKASADLQVPQAAEASGGERELAVLFVDMRGFTALTESRLPFDIIYILNRFFASVGQPIHDVGGWIANYAGDGLIALFGDETGAAATCRAALVACAEIDRAAADLNRRMGAERRQPTRIAMGLHVGLHVVGRVGYGTGQAASVIGFAMNVASRLEAMAKGANVQLAVSRVVAEHGGLDIAGLRAEPADVRGLSAPIEVVFVPAAVDLLDRLSS